MTLSYGGFCIMVLVTRQQLGLALVAGLMIGALSGVAQAGMILSIYADDPYESISGAALGLDTGAMQTQVDQQHEKPRTDDRLLRELEVLSLIDSLVIGLQAADSPGMSGGGSSVSGSSPHSAPVACVFNALNLCDPPLRDRIFDNSCVILPSGPIFELLRPA